MTDDGRTYPGRAVPRHSGTGPGDEEPHWPADDWSPADREWPPGPYTDRYPGRPDPLTDPSPAYPPRARHGYPGEERPAYRDGPPPGYPDEPRGYNDRGYSADDPRYAGDGAYPGERYPGEDQGAGGGAYPGGTGNRRARGGVHGRPDEGPGRDGSYPGRDESPYPGGGGYPGPGPYPGGPPYPADRGRYPEPGFYRDESPYHDPYRDDGPHRDDGPYRDEGPYRDGGPPWADDRYDDDRFVPGMSGPDDRDDRDERDDRDGRGDGPGERRRGRRGGSPGSGSGRGGKRGRSRAAVLIAVLVILTPIAVAVFFAFRFVEGKYFPADYSTAGGGQVVVQVQSGQTATSVAPRLVTLGVVASSRAFVLAAEHSPNQTGLEPGFYRLHKHMKASLAYALMLSPSSRVQNKLTIPEGLRVSQILAALGAHSGIPAADFQKALANPGSLGLPSYANGKPEGFLFPATYNIQPNQTATAVLQGMVQQFNSYAASINLTHAAARANLTPTQLVTVASLLQAEGGRVSDYPKIARVVYNRLAAGMKLQFDSTVLYGLGQFGTRATDAQLQSTSPYNSYKYKGLPPGPIDSPGNAAFQAALHPAVGNWLYFVSDKNGVTRFSDTLSGLNG
jgi:UPF0755 protein